MTLQLPIGNCVISNETVFEGSTGLGINFIGTKGFGNLADHDLMERSEFRHHAADVGMQWLHDQ